MSQHKKQQTKNRGWLKTDGQTSNRKKAATTFALELLESRVLLSADLAAAVQPVPVQPLDAPQQAVVLNVPAPAASQQTWPVSEILARHSSSFQPSNDSAPATQTDGSSLAANATTHTVAEILAQPAQSNLDENKSLSTQLPLTNVPTTPSIQPDSLTTSGEINLDLPRASADTSTPSPSLPVTDEPTQQTSTTGTTTSSIQNDTVTTSGEINLDLPQASADTSTPSTSLPVIDEPTQPTSANVVTPSPIQNDTVTTNGAINPELPRASVDTSMPTTSVTVRVGPHGDYTDLQSALNNVSLGTTILLEPGVSYTTTNDSGFILPNKTTGTGWIVIRPDVPDSALPAAGTRVTAADSAWMPKIVRANSNVYAISSDAGAHNYRIIGVEVMNRGNVDTPLVGGALVNLSSTQETTIEGQSHHILFDRTYIHGPSTGGSAGVKFGIVFGGQYEGVIDSTIEDITYGSDAIAVGSWSGAGPFLIRNNALSSSGENIMFGGADTRISNLVPSDIEIRNNYIYKPLKWRDDPAYNSGPNKILVKNLFEAKNAQRVLVDGNVFENMWPSAQPGFAMTFTPRQASSASNQPWTVVQDITITNNKFISTANGLAISGQDYGRSASGEPPTSLGSRYLIKNNLFLNNGGYAGTGTIFQMGNGVSDVTIQHNTVVASTDQRGTTLMFLYGAANGDFTPMERFVLQDNLLQARSYPYGAEGGLSAAIPGYLWTNNVFTGPWPTSGGWTAAMMPQGNGNSYPASETNVGYVNATGGDYRLASISPYKGAASDGKDIGVDWNQFNAANS